MHPYPRHVPGFDYLGQHRYFLTFCTDQRRALFLDQNAVRLVERHFLRLAAERGFADLAHCFMPDHFHAVVAGRHDSADLKAFVTRMKQFSGYHFQRDFGCRLWQRYSYERVLRGDESTGAVIRYVLENPIRAELVASVQDYPFIGSSEYSLEQLLEFCIGGGASG